MKDGFPALLMDAIRFEQWLRFYFMEDENGSMQDDCGANEASSFLDLENESEKTMLRIPADVLLRIADKMPDLAALAQALDGSVISAESSRSSIFAFLKKRFGLGDADFGACILQVIEDPDFRRALDAFHGYVQYLANNEKDDGVPFFDEWMTRFDAWAKDNDIPFINSVSRYRPEMDALKHPELLDTAENDPRS